MTEKYECLMARENISALQLNTSIEAKTKWILKERPTVC